mmetsp:Transcript_10862/g.36596  ORF Transcript_10862/g.36596 Transcript_10862/m.36596 type:complete len:137 (-) Transcript_10862:369-779(-)
MWGCSNGQYRWSGQSRGQRGLFLFSERVSETRLGSVEGCNEDGPRQKESFVPYGGTGKAWPRQRRSSISVRSGGVAHYVVYDVKEQTWDERPKRRATSRHVRQVDAARGKTGASNDRPTTTTDDDDRRGKRRKEAG